MDVTPRDLRRPRLAAMAGLSSTSLLTSPDNTSAAGVDHYAGDPSTAAAAIAAAAAAAATLHSVRTPMQSILRSGSSPPSGQYTPRNTSPAGSSTNAQLLAGMHPAATAFLRSQPVSTEAAATSRPEQASFTDGGHEMGGADDRAAAAASTAVALATSEDVLRGIYNEKLHASVHSVIATLTAELPQDHIFLQLLADDTTRQYCKVRLAEVVEGFLYSTQAEQFHALATEMARRERDCAAQQQRIGELEAALAAVQAASAAAAEAASARSSTHTFGSTGAGGSAEDRFQLVPSPHVADPAPSQPSRSPSLPSPSSVAMAPAGSAGAAHSAFESANASTPAGDPRAAPASVNPMDDEEARRELLRILEQTTHDLELHRCTQALHAVTKVVDVAATDTPQDATDGDFFYEEALVAELYACVQSLLGYVDAALESQERLRHELAEQQQQQHQHQRPPHRMASEVPAGRRKEVDEAEALVGGDSNRATPLPGAARRVGGSVAPPRSTSHDDDSPSTPRRPQVQLGVSSAPMHSAVSSHFSSVSAPDNSRAAHTQPIHKQRERLQHLAAQLREGQARAAEVMAGLARADAARRREVAQLQRSLSTAREEAAIAARTDDELKQLRDVCERHRAAAAAAAVDAGERTELRDQLADVQAQLAAARQDVQTARQETRAATARAESAEEQVAVLAASVAAARATAERRTSEVQEAQCEQALRVAELTELHAAYQVSTDAVQDAARELLCLRVERTMAALSAVYQEAKAAKAELVEREGYRPLVRACSLAVAAQQEAARHAEAQRRSTELAQQEQAAVQRGCVDALSALLRSMWADDAIELAAAAAGEGAGNAASSLLSADNWVDTDAAPGDAHAGRSRRNATTASDDAVPASAAPAVAAPAASSYRLPTTLKGFCGALESAYHNVRARHKARQHTIDLLRAELIERDIELRAAQASDAQLRERLRAEQAKEEQWKAEMAQLGEHNPMRGLLARQDSLLKAVSEERNELRRLWNRLSGDYIALEQRNGVLHARCAEKEHENARLSGILRRGGAPVPSTVPVTATTATAAAASTVTTHGGDTAGAARGDDAAAAERPTTTPAAPRDPEQWDGSPGRSSPAPTSTTDDDGDSSAAVSVAVAPSQP